MSQSGKHSYTGEFRHNLDDKNRLTIPSLWRYVHGESDIFLATPHPDGYIAVLPPAEVEKLHDKVAQKALTDSTAQETFARFFSRTLAFTFDKQGRFGLSTDLLKHAGVRREAVLVGTLNKFGIWSPDRWKRLEERTSADQLGDLMRRIGI